jgi:hypothetical protein
MRICVSRLFFGILVLCSSPPWGIWFLVWSSHALDLVVVMYFLYACSVLSGLWCSLDVGFTETMLYGPSLTV